MSLSLTRRLCEWLACHLPLRRITRGIPPHEGDYLDRYYLAGRAPAYFPTRCRFCGRESDWKVARRCGFSSGTECESELFPTRLAFLPTVFLHHFLDSDQEEELHNHPWHLAVSFVLAGGYVEERRSIPRGRRQPGSPYVTEFRDVLPGRLNVIRADDFHRAVLRERDAWTLFVTFKKARSWGFWSKKTGEFVPWREYRAWKEAQLDALRATDPGPADYADKIADSSVEHRTVPPESNDAGDELPRGRSRE